MFSHRKNIKDKLAIVALMLVWLLAANIILKPFVFAQDSGFTRHYVFDISPSINFDGLPIYSGMEIPDDAALMLNYEFVAESGVSFDNIAIILPRYLVAAHSGFIDMEVRNNYDTHIEAGSIFADVDGNISLSLNLENRTSGSALAIIHSASTLDNEKINDSPVYYTVSFEIPAMFDLEAIANDEVDGFRVVTLLSNNQEITVYLVSAIEPLFMPLSLRPEPPAIVWSSIFSDSTNRPFGSVHDFGVLVFGDMVVDYSSAPYGSAHMESNVAIGGNISLTNAYADFGGAHTHIPGHVQNPPNIWGITLLLGGNFYGLEDINSSTGQNNNQGSSGYYASAILHLGDLLMRAENEIIITDVTAPRIETSSGIHDRDNNPSLSWPDNWPLVPLTPVGDTRIPEFFSNAYTELSMINEFYFDLNSGENEFVDDNGNVTLRVWRGNPTGGANPWSNLYADPPSAFPVNHFDTLVFDLEIERRTTLPNGQPTAPFGVIRVPIVNFPLGFEGSYVFNIDMEAFNYDIIKFSNEMGLLAHDAPPFPYSSYSHRILWNFWGDGEIDSLTVNNVALNIFGSLLAPDATFYAPAGGSIKGFLMIGEFIHDAAGFEKHTVTPPNPPIPPGFEIPPPPPTNPQPPPPPPIHPTPPPVDPPTTEPPTYPYEPPIYPYEPPVDPYEPPIDPEIEPSTDPSIELLTEPQEGSPPAPLAPPAPPDIPLARPNPQTGDNFARTHMLLSLFIALVSIVIFIAVRVVHGQRIRVYNTYVIRKRLEKRIKDLLS